MSMEEIDYLRSEVARLQDLLDRRPAINQGLYEAYVRWTSLVYTSDSAAMRWNQPLIRLAPGDVH